MAGFGGHRAMKSKTASSVSTVLPVGEVEPTSLLSPNSSSTDKANNWEDVLDSSSHRAFRLLPGIPSPILLVRNFMTIDMLKKPIDGADGIARRELHKECSKVGTVKDIHVYVQEDQKDPSNAVRLFVVFEKVTSAIRAMEILGNRLYGGRHILVSFYNAMEYEDMNYSV